MSQDLAPGAAIQAIGSTSALATAGASYANTTGTITTATSSVTTGNIGAAGNVTAYLYGTHAGVTVVFEISPDNTNWFPVSMNREDNGLADITSGPLPANSVRAWTMGAPGLNFFRVRATAWTSGTANIVIIAGTYPFEPLVAQRSRKAPTYRAYYRATARAYQLSNAFTANTRKQYATIHHAASATKTVRLRLVRFWLYTSTAVVDLRVDLVRITTAPATGNPAITPTPADTSDAAAEATCLALPTTAATEGALFTSFPTVVGITGGGPATNPPPITNVMDLLSPSAYDDEAKMPTIRAGVLEGWAVTLDSNTATTVTGMVEIEFAEEAP